MVFNKLMQKYKILFYKARLLRRFIPKMAILDILFDSDKYANVRFRGLMGMASHTDDEETISADFGHINNWENFWQEFWSEKRPYGNNVDYNVRGARRIDISGHNPFGVRHLRDLRSGLLRFYLLEGPLVPPADPGGPAVWLAYRTQHIQNQRSGNQIRKTSAGIRRLQDSPDFRPAPALLRQQGESPAAMRG